MLGALYKCGNKYPNHKTARGTKFLQYISPQNINKYDAKQLKLLKYNICQQKTFKRQK